ncbi:sulfatase-like hydrolase/transferase [Haloplanus salinarum]|uniref:sulfatase-like hydrolase/transferase n=1 Tax=Haloplanus salinarum TaxID=1912324 RepID=UPI00214CF396|nr:sulfatase-like hydrolase/transferase [Haloplanus salinarum]
MTNVVLLVLDTARVSAVDLAKRSTITPELVEIAGSGVSADTAIAKAPWTLPSHASLFTATDPSKHGAHAGHKRLSDEPQTLAETFAVADYETVAVSNNTWISEEFGFARGFETFVKTWQYVQTDTDLGEIARTEEGTDKLRAVVRRLFDGNPLTNLANAVYGQFLRNRGDDGAKRTNEWIADWLADRTDDRPFFLFVNYLEPHLEYRPPREHAERFLPDGVTFEEAMDVPQDAWGYIADTVEMTDRDFEILRALYRAEIAYLDDRIGELRRHLEAAGEWEDTIFVVTADHGENIGDHGLMDHQYCLYDTLLHVPLVIHGGPFTGGGTVDDLVQLTDLGPTLLDAAGVDAPEFREQAQGRSFHPDADADPREFAICEYLAPQPSMDALEKRVGTLPDDVRRYDRSLRAIRDDEWKLIRGSDGSTELYDVVDDPEERTDLSDDNPEQVSRLSSTLDDWLDSFEHADVSGTVDMTDDTKERLEDLGYLQ